MSHISLKISSFSHIADKYFQISWDVIVVKVWFNVLNECNMLQLKYYWDICVLGLLINHFLITWSILFDLIHFSHLHWISIRKHYFYGVPTLPLRIIMCQKMMWWWNMIVKYEFEIENLRYWLPLILI